MTHADGTLFEELALPHLEMLYRVARRLVRDPHEAEDLVQETYLKAHRAFGQFEARAYGIRPWLLKILNNTFLNRAAKEKHAPRSAAPEVLESNPTDGGQADPPDLDYERLDQEVKRALDLLSPEFRAVLLLWATMELSYREIAATLDLPIGTVMSRLHRARQQLVAALAEYSRANRIGPLKART